MTDTTLPQSSAASERKSVVYKRDKKTKASVIWADKIAGRVIVIGGFSVILAVFTIMVYLVMVTAPLIGGGSVTDTRSYTLASSAGNVISTSMDEYLSMGVEFMDDGSLESFHASTGERLANPIATGIEGAKPTAFARTIKGSDIALGFADGTVRLGRITIKAMVMPASSVPATLTKIGSDRTDGTSIFIDVPGKQVRRLTPTIEMETPVQVAPAGTPIHYIDYRVGGTSERPVKIFATVDEAGVARLSSAFSQVNMMTGETSTSIINSEINTGLEGKDIAYLLLNTQGDRLLVAGKDGSLRRFDTRDLNAPRLAETTRVTPAGVGITALGWMNGEQSLIVGGADGSLTIWAMIDRNSKDTADGNVLTEIHNIARAGAPITQFSVSQRTRLFAAADEAGNVALYHGTTAREIFTFPDTQDKAPIATLLLAPRDDGVMAIDQKGLAHLWTFSVPHPETTLGSLFGKVWYEGYPEPTYAWQSTAGTDSFEPKLSLVPLIFGTIKGALYSLIFAVPIALLAAIYTSEFMHFRIRAVIKPLMELMASLPSVVIGFVVALVLSPIVENWIAAVMIAFAVIPLTFVGSAFLWQLLPKPLALRLDGFPKIGAFFVAMAVAIWLTMLAGPFIERVLFAGDFKAWTGGEGSAVPFLFLLSLPMAFLIVFSIGGRLLGQPYRDMLRRKPYHIAGLYELGRWLAFTLVSFLLAWGVSEVLGVTGYDARGGIISTYVQRNTLIAAFGIAFAVIPIIYSIAEDALGAVPEHLRSASLGCGATKWQTASWVILPTAGSGIFSAIMIGLGRAVGETMIVVMATGNTPVTDWSLFSGLRALSANINVELPEAVKDSTLYRTLFLCGLVLFVMTFVLNTFAEIVRQRFRKRAAQL